MTLVADASVIVAALIDDSPAGAWARQVLGSDSIAAPHHLPAEVASALRRLISAGAIAPEVATLAHADLAAMPVVLMPYAPVADRVWALRQDVTPYDAWYVALAETLGVGLATRDLRLVASSRPTCPFVTAPA